MPENIGNHGLYCPDFDDYAAVALFMQDLGTKIDDALQAQVDALDTFFSPPTIILTNTVAKVIPAADQILDVFDTVVFNNSTFLSYNFTTNSLHIGSPAGITPVIPYSRGAYTAGAGVRMTATGAVSVGSERRLSLVFNDDTGDGTGDVFNPLVFPEDRTIDQNTGGNEGLNVEINFLLTGTNGVVIDHRAVSDNAASTTTIPAGSAFLWVTFNGASEVVEVA